MPVERRNLFSVMENALRDATEPLSAADLYDIEDVKQIATSLNRVSDYLGVLFRKGLVSRIAAAKDTSASRVRFKYIWKKKELPEWAKREELADHIPKTILNRPSIYITEEGGQINIELPHLSIVIKSKP